MESWGTINAIYFSYTFLNAKIQPRMKQMKGASEPVKGLLSFF